MSSHAPFEKRLWSNVEKIEGGCWIWHGFTDYEGYGKIGKDHKLYFVHRLVYEMLVAPIPVGLEIDHLCRNRACCNPAHLEPVTHAENMHRSELSGWNSRIKTHCPKGHPLSGENVYRHNGRRHCRQCRRETAMRLYYANKASARCA